APPLRLSFFLSTAPAPTAIYTLSLHDALPICRSGRGASARAVRAGAHRSRAHLLVLLSVHELCLHLVLLRPARAEGGEQGEDTRSEEHTSELQSRGHLVCRLLLEKKKKKKHDH